MNGEKLTALIILYNPVYENVYKLVAVLESEVDQILIVNNGTIDDHYNVAKLSLERRGVDFLEMNGNAGIARALNSGVVQAKVGGANFCWLFDQDSLPSKGGGNTLLKSYHAAKSVGYALAAVTPLVLDQNGGRILPMMVDAGKGKIVEEVVKEKRDVMAAITSGMLIDVDAWLNNTGANESYFIDFVDTEWCFRMRSRGYRIICDPNVILTHRLGDVRAKSMGFRGRVIRHRAPMRTYYFVRNGLLLTEEAYAPINWMPYVLKRILKVVLIGAIAGPHRIEQLMAASRAVRFVINHKRRI